MGVLEPAIFRLNMEALNSLAGWLITSSKEFKKILQNPFIRVNNLHWRMACPKEFAD